MSFSKCLVWIHHTQVLCYDNIFLIHKLFFCFNTCYLLYDIDKLPDLDLSVEEDENASYDTSEYDEAMGTRPELPAYLDIEGDEDYDEVLGD